MPHPDCGTFRSAEDYRDHLPCHKCEPSKLITSLAKFRRVIIESPYSGDVARNLRYLKDARADCVRRGESPYASHHMLTDVLNDMDGEERKRGMGMGFAWIGLADATVVYHDLGVTHGMRAGIEVAEGFDKPVEYRSLPEWAKLYIDGQYIGNGHHL